MIGGGGLAVALFLVCVVILLVVGIFVPLLGLMIVEWVI